MLIDETTNDNATTAGIIQIKKDFQADVVSAVNSQSEKANTVIVGAFVDIEEERQYGHPNSEGGWGYVREVNVDGSFNITLALGGLEHNGNQNQMKKDNPMSVLATKTTSNPME